MTPALTRGILVLFGTADTASEGTGVHVYCSPYGSGKVDITVDQLAEILGLVEVSK